MITNKKGPALVLALLVSKAFVIIYAYDCLRAGISTKQAVLNEAPMMETH
jgi:hypothetical protein